MDRRGVMVAAAAMGFAPGLARAAKPRIGLRVMSFNVRLPVDSDGPNRWEARRDLFVETIRRCDPDMIGTQELWKVQGDYAVERLPQFSWFGIDRRGGRGDEHMGVFFRRDRMKVIDLGHFWLSDTPDVPGSISWGHPYPRMATWGLFETVAGKRFWLINTHFPYRAEDEVARSKCAAAIAKWVAKRPAGEVVVLTGDFNTGPESEAHRILSAGLADAWVAAPERTGPEGTFHGFSGTPGKRIDWVMARGLTPVAVETVDFGRGGRFPSDHFPVVADYRWP
ncbi:MAG: endonuclease/exonuclease/phosphatase family protein [Sphingomonas sp.]|uniref:endonuclease/exonuclease/phosphatase family protein n=1 Tax=Sphingomonas sp. TaxID=28214 RepID=UPI0026215C5C|nr:endonuclease/exonuclease/phosphatase family protein [Sphingomonas sp.]MDK2767682.1 endonuclease/exonuclease/phosphatase family protein [Sphingomonas sp.]